MEEPVYVYEHENQFDVRVTGEELIQGANHYDIYDVKIRGGEDADELKLEVNGRVIGSATPGDSQAFRELRRIEEAIRAAWAGEEEPKEMSREEMIAADAMSRAGTALSVANDASETASLAGVVFEEVWERMEKVENKVEEAARSGGGGAPTITVETPDGEQLGEETEGLVHRRLQDLVRLMNMRMHVLLIGGAGTGKTHGVKQAAELIGRDVKVFRGHEHAVADDLFGFVTAGDGHFQPGPAYDAVKEGKVLYIDELDVCTPSFVKGANNLTDRSEYVSFPNGERVEKHEDFVLVASANTIGQGATASYTGASGQLDASSLDRLVFLDWGIDENIEDTLADAHADEQGLDWARKVKQYRAAVDYLEEPIEITPRATIKGAKLLSAGFSEERVKELTLTGKMTERQIEEVEETIEEVVLDEDEDGIEFRSESFDDLPDTISELLDKLDPEVLDRYTDDDDEDDAPEADESPDDELPF